MPTVSGPPGRWEALGRLLQRQRTTLSPRYKDRSVFARETHINDRLLGDLERARRHTYRDTTLRAVEGAYGLAEDAIVRFVEGAVDGLDPAPEIADADPLTAPEDDGEHWDGEITGPDGPLYEDERMCWRDEPKGRWYLYAVDQFEHETMLDPDTPPEKAAPLLRAQLAQRVMSVTGKMMGRPQEATP